MWQWENSFNNSKVQLAVVREASREPEVCDLRHSVRIHENILQEQVSVNDVLYIRQEIHSVCNLC